MEQANQALQNEQGAIVEWTPKTFNVKVWMDVNGNPIMQEVTEDELLNGYLRQSDYTKKTQELAREREMLDQRASQAQDVWYKWDPADDEAVEAYLQSKGYAKKETVEQLVEEKIKWLTKSQQDEQTIQSLIASNPNLKQFEGAIRKIAATENDAIEDIVVRYGFTTPNELSKAKQRGIVGWADKLGNERSKPVAEWTKADWDRFEKQYNVSAFR